MEEIKVKALVLKSLDYKEKDKLLDLFSLEKGKITASLRGVRSPKAKLKFASEILNFCEYCLVCRNDKYTITNASQITSFFSIAKNYKAYLIACVILEILNKVLKPEEENAEILLLTLKIFNLLQQVNVNSELVLLKFYLEILNLMGFKLEFNNCLNCSKKLEKEIYFSFDNGSFVCKNCKNFYDVLVLTQDFELLKTIETTPVEKIDTLIINQNLSNILNILNKNLEMRCFINVKSFAQLL